MREILFPFLAGAAGFAAAVAVAELAIIPGHVEPLRRQRDRLEAEVMDLRAEADAARRELARRPYRPAGPAAGETIPAVWPPLPVR